MTEQLGKPTVERLSDVAWARVERNVFSRMAEGTVTSAAAAREIRSERPANKWLWLAVPGAAAAAFALAFFSMNGPAPGPQIAEGPSRVVAGAAPSSVSFGDAHVTLDANSAVVMDQAAGKPTALLENGAAVFTVSPRADRAHFTVLAGDASIRATNSEFRVAREGERASVTVETGSVEIRFRGHEIHVAAKHTWVSDDLQAR
jgi:ferric-dicitrate binding protein FerR (iron transport regulator)